MFPNSLKSAFKTQFSLPKTQIHFDFVILLLMFSRVPKYFLSGDEMDGMWEVEKKNYKDDWKKVDKTSNIASNCCFFIKISLKFQFSSAKRFLILVQVLSKQNTDGDKLMKACEDRYNSTEQEILQLQKIIEETAALNKNLTNNFFTSKWQKRFKIQHFQLHFHQNRL